MNCPELIERLALGSVISMELADRLLGAVKDAAQVASNNRKPVPPSVEASDLLGPKCAIGNATLG